MDDLTKTRRLAEALRKEGAERRAEAAASERPTQAPDESKNLTEAMSSELADTAQACTEETGKLPAVDVDIHRRKELAGLLERAQLEGCADTAAKIIAFETARQGTPFVSIDSVLDIQYKLDVARKESTAEVVKGLLDTLEKGQLEDDVSRAFKAIIASQTAELKTPSRIDPRKAEYNLYLKKREFAGELMSDFTMLINILDQFQNTPEEERASWCEANYLQLEVLEAVLDRYHEVLEYYASQGIEAGENNSDEDAVGRSICAGYRGNLMMFCGEGYGRKASIARYSSVFDSARPVNPDTSSVMHFPDKSFLFYDDDTLSPPICPSLIVASKPRAKGVSGIALCHPAKNEWIYQVSPEWVRQKVKYMFCYDYDSFSADVMLKQSDDGAGIVLGTLHDIPREQEDCRNAFAHALINNGQLQKFLLEVMGMTESQFFFNEFHGVQDFLENYFGYERFNILIDQRPMLISDFVTHIYRKKLEGIEASKDALAARIDPAGEDPLDLFITTDECRDAAEELGYDALK